MEYQTQHFTLSMVTGYQFLKDCMDIDQDFTANDIYTCNRNNAPRTERGNHLEE